MVWCDDSKPTVALKDGEGFKVDLGALGTVTIGRDCNEIHIEVQKADVKFKQRYIQLDLVVK